MDLHEEYTQNPDFKEYVDKTMASRQCTLDEALTLLSVRHYAEYLHGSLVFPSGECYAYK